jgi:hypothetical protein
MFRKRFFQEYIFQSVIGVGVTAAVTAFAVLAKLWTWPNAVVGAVLLLCGLLYLAERLGIGPTERTRVRNWLDESGFAIQTVSDTNSIHFVLVDNIGFYTHVVQVKSGDPLSIAMPGLKPDDKHLATFATMDDAAKQAFWKKIRIELLRTRTQFSNLKLDGEGVTISTQLSMARTLTGVEFLREMVIVRSAGRLYLEMINEALPEQKQLTAPGVTQSTQ